MDAEDKNAWVKQANCKGLDPNLFFHEGRYDTNPALDDDNIAAIKICLGCEVRKECLIDCSKSDDFWRYGIWAGTTPGSRKNHISRNDVKNGTFDFSMLDRPLSYGPKLEGVEILLTQKAS